MIAVRLRSEYAAITRCLLGDYKKDRATIMQRSGNDYAAVAQRLCSGCATIMQRLRNDYAAVAQRLQIDSAAITQ
jgi:hypothetical protein